MTRHLWKIALPLFALAWGCGGSWTVVKQANPNPLVGQKAIGVDAVSFDTMKVGNPGTITEAEWVAKKKPDEQAKFKEDLDKSKSNLNGKFLKAFGDIAQRGGVTATGGVQAGQWSVKPVITELEPGYNAFVARAPAVVKMELHFMDPQGQEVDVILVQAQMDAGSFGDMAERLGMCGDSLGNQGARYLNSRVAAAK
jgi:hypothetical protein